MNVFTPAQQQDVHRTAQRILAEVGLEVGHDRLLEALDGIGARVDADHRRAHFPPALVDEFIASVPKIQWDARVPDLWGRAALFYGKYLDPETDELVPVTPARMHDYFKVAKALPNTNSYFLTGCQWPVAPMAEPLWERFHAWKYGIGHSGTLYPTATGENILELCHAYAAMQGVRVEEVAGGSVFLMSPLKLGAEEAAQFVWWWERGFRVGIAHMSTAGLSAPVTLAGLIALHIAEGLALALFHKACYGETSWSCGGMVSAADARTLIRPYGRPELAMANMMLASMARFYSVGCFAQSGLTDAKLPTVEAGAQKAMTTLATLMAGADTLVDCGTLAVDEVASPLQMILDDELVAALRRLLVRPAVDEETLAYETIRGVGPGGGFMGTEHTVRWFREVLWEPRVWTQEMLPAWEQHGGLTDLEQARRLHRELLAGAPDPAVMDPEDQERLLTIIRRVDVSNREGQA